MPYRRFQTAFVTCALLITVLAAAAPVAEDVTPTSAGTPTTENPPGEGPTGGDPPSTTGFDTPIPNPLVGVKPLLVVLLEFTDLPHTASVTPTFLRNQVFGARPSLNDFYLEQSYGQYSFSDVGNWAWVTAYNDPGTSADESTRAYWNTAPDPTYRGGTFQRWGLKSLDVAGYDFAPLDVNTDGKVTFGPEVAYLLIDSQVDNARGGAMRGMPDGFTFDGKTIEGVACGVSEDSPWITLYAHELGHQSSWGGPWFLTDYYGIQPQNIGSFSLMGYSGYGNGTRDWAGPIGPHHLDSPSKLKLGWVAPTVVAADGYYNIRDAETNAEMYLLYDAAHGKDEYYLVENRML